MQMQGDAVAAEAHMGVAGAEAAYVPRVRRCPHCKDATSVSGTSSYLGMNGENMMRWNTWTLECTKEPFH